MKTSLLLLVSLLCFAFQAPLRAQAPAGMSKVEADAYNAAYAAEMARLLALKQSGQADPLAAPEVEAIANLVPDTGDVYLVPAFAGLGAPYWDGYARGTLLGMTRGTTRAHIARAALEAIALQVADVFDAMARDSGIALKELRVDGGACSNNLLMQMQADFLGVPVVRPKVTETTALGAAYLAGLATGLWQDAAEISSQWQVDRRFEPQLGAAQRRAKLARWRQAVERSKAWADN